MGVPERAVMGKLDYFLIQSSGPLPRGLSNFEKGLRGGFLAESGTPAKKYPLLRAAYPFSRLPELKMKIQKID
jgi:hypothetical protein